MMMNRRQAIRNIGLGAGYVVAAPAVFNLLQSCKGERSLDWEPTFLTAANGFALKQLLDVIIPTTDTPGANDVNVAQFIDSYFNEVAKSKQQEEFKAGANAFAINFKSTFDKDIVDGEAQDYEKIVAKYLGAEPAKRDEYLKRQSAKQDPEAPETEIDTEASSFGYLETVRGLAIWAWKSSEEIGENVLWYDPVPGAQKGCISLDEAGNGKAMSL